MKYYKVIFIFMFEVLFESTSSSSEDMAALSPSDPNSYSRPDLVKTTHVHLEVEVNFEKKILVGSVLLTLEKIDLEADSVILDARNLTVSKVFEEPSGQTLDYTYGSPSGFGEKFEIKLPAGAEKKLSIRVEYSSSPEATALQWLSPAQTAGKKHPYMFSQCQAGRDTRYYRSDQRLP